MCFREFKMAAAVDDNDDIILSRTAAFSSMLGQELETLRKDVDFTDFTLKSQDKVIECHRAVIAVNSPVLKAMLKSQMKETTQKQIELNNISPPAMDKLVEYMYTGKARIRKENLKDVVEAADFLQMNELKQMCIYKVPAVLQPNNVTSWLDLSDKMNLTELHTHCSQIMTSQLEEMKSGQEFLELKIAELKSCLLQVKQNGADPDDLLGASLDWASADPEDRGDEMEALLRALPMEKCSLQCLEEEQEKHQKLLISNPRADKVITDNLMRIAEDGSSRKTRRSQKSGYLVLGGDNGTVANNLCWIFDSTCSLTELYKIPDEHLHLSCSFCKTPEGFAVTGGEGCDDAAIFNMKNKTWKKLAKLLVKRFAHGSVFIKGLLFIFGGRIDGSESSSVHYLEENGSWQSGPDMPEVGDNPEVASMGDDVFLLETWTNQLFKLNIGTKSWSKMASLPGCRSGGARMIQVSDKLCFVGGCSDKTLAWYTPFTNTWTRAANPKLKHAWGAALHQHNTIIILGGSGQERAESYDMDSGVWSICDWEMPKKLCKLHGLKLD